MVKDDTKPDAEAEVKKTPPAPTGPYSKATPEMLEICEELIGLHHDHLLDSIIAIISKHKSSTVGGKTILATASIPSKKMRPLLDQDYDFIIFISLVEWQGMDDAKRHALIDHELCHCGFNDKRQPKIIGHDLEEFGAIIMRHGLWRGDLLEQKMSQAFLFTQGRVSAPDLKAEGE